MIIKLGTPTRAEVIDSVIGQLSDGIWENNGSMNKYWMFARVKGTDLEISEDYSKRYGSSRTIWNGFDGKSEKEIKDWFANKAKQVVKIWAEDYHKDQKAVWDRDNTDVVDYMGGHGVPNVTVADVYECYDFLKGRSGKKYGTTPIEEPEKEPITEPYEVVDEVVEPKVSGGMNPSQQELEDFFTGASTRIGRKGYIRASSDCYIDTQSGEKVTYDELKQYWDENKNDDWVLAQFSSFEDWFNTSKENGFFKRCNDDDIEACGYIGASDGIFSYGKCLGYGVDYRNMHTGIHGILVFADIDEAEQAYDDLKQAEYSKDEYEYNDILDDVLESVVEDIDEINFRDFVNVDGDKVYPYSDDEFIIIVNDFAVDLYL